MSFTTKVKLGLQFEVVFKERKDRERMQSDFELKKVHVRDMDQERKDGGAHRDCSYTGPRIWCYKLMIDL